MSVRRSLSVTWDWADVRVLRRWHATDPAAPYLFFRFSSVTRQSGRSQLDSRLALRRFAWPLRVSYTWRVSFVVGDVQALLVALAANVTAFGWRCFALAPPPHVVPTHKPRFRRLVQYRYCCHTPSRRNCARKARKDNEARPALCLIPYYPTVAYRSVFRTTL